MRVVVPISGQTMQAIARRPATRAHLLEGRNALDVLELERVKPALVEKRDHFGSHPLELLEEGCGRKSDE